VRERECWEERVRAEEEKVRESSSENERGRKAVA
jgi:hypothetical protein